jgi:hypothetical protein
MRRSRQICGIATALLVVIPLGTAVAGKPAKLNLTARVTKASSSAKQGEKILLALKQGPKTVGSTHFPGCAGTGTSFICGGTVSLDGIGSNLATIVTFQCPPKPPFTCLPAVGTLMTKKGAVKGTITLKTQPEKLTPGATFPAIFAPGPAT